MQVGGINQIHLPLFFMMLLACLLIQAATNMFNEYFDYKRGLDHEGSVGIGGAIVRDGIKPKTVLNLAFGFLGIATLLGVYICMNSSGGLLQSVLFVWPLLTFTLVAPFQLRTHHLES